MFSFITCHRKSSQVVLYSKISYPIFPSCPALILLGTVFSIAGYKIFMLYSINQARGPRWENIGPRSWQYVQKNRGPIFSQYGPELTWLIRGIFRDWKCWGKKNTTITDWKKKYCKSQTRNSILIGSRPRRVVTSDVKRNRRKRGVGRERKRIIYATASSFRNASHKTTRKSSRVIVRDHSGQCLSQHYLTGNGTE